MDGVLEALECERMNARNRCLRVIAVMTIRGFVMGN
jgi:hypothetical protein